TSPILGTTTSPGPTQYSTSITLICDAMFGATYYEVGVVDVATGVLVVDTTSTSASYTASLSAGKAYRWNVAACNSSGCSSYTSQIGRASCRESPSTTASLTPGTRTSQGHM